MRICCSASALKYSLPMTFQSTPRAVLDIANLSFTTEVLELAEELGVCRCEPYPLLALTGTLGRGSGREGNRFR
jgi:hypothetical protein